MNPNIYLALYQTVMRLLCPVSSLNKVHADPLEEWHKADPLKEWHKPQEKCNKLRNMDYIRNATNMPGVIREKNESLSDNNS